MTRVKINREKKEILLSFNDKFYTEEHINQALKDFGEICDFRKEGKTIVLTPKKGTDLDRLGYEFYNYVFGLMKNM